MERPRILAFSCWQFLLSDSSGISNKPPQNSIVKNLNKGPLSQALIHHSLLLPTGLAKQRGKVRNCNSQRQPRSTGLGVSLGEPSP